jgi:hypothetical protein
MAKYNMKRTKTKAEHEYTKKKHSNNAKIHSVDDNEQDGKNEMKLLFKQ